MVWEEESEREGEDHDMITPYVRSMSVCMYKVPSRKEVDWFTP